MMNFDYQKRYRVVTLPSGMQMEVYLLGKMSNKTAMGISRMGKFIELNTDTVESSVQCKITELEAEKLNLFGLRYSRWQKSWMDKPHELDKLTRDWKKVALEDDFIDSMSATQIIDSKIADVRGYTASIGNWVEPRKCSVRLEGKVPMNKELSDYVAKCVLIGMNKYDIASTELFQKISKKLLKKSGKLWGSAVDCYRSSVTFDLETDSIVHEIIRTDGVLQSRRTLEDLAEEMLKELVWKGPKMA